MPISSVELHAASARGDYRGAPCMVKGAPMSAAGSSEDKALDVAFGHARCRPVG